MEYRLETCLFLFLILSSVNVSGQDLPELPVQLIGFPVIIGSVKLTNFLKKLSYSLSPATYRSRSRRELAFGAGSADIFDVEEVEKYITSEYGAQACVFESICAHYAARALTKPRPELDWPEVFSQYKQTADEAKELYLFSVFLGDIVGSPQLCRQLGKRRGCNKDLLG